MIKETEKKLKWDLAQFKKKHFKNGKYFGGKCKEGLVIM